MEEPVEDLPVVEDSGVTCWQKCKAFVSVYWRGVVMVLTPIVLIGILFPWPAEKYQWCAYTLCLMAVYWVVECIPLPVTSFLPIIIFPMASIMSTAETCRCYMNDTILMFLGSLMLAYAVEQSGLHRRLALCAIRGIGYSHYRLLFAICFITMFISMWITNTAATTMMVPINFAILKVFENQGIFNIYDTDHNGNLVASDITTCYFCAATYSATIGGIGTLVGTATNLVFKGLFMKMYPDSPEYLSFPKFSVFAIPYMLCMELALYFCLLVQFFGFLRKDSKAAKLAHITPEAMEAAKLAVEEQWQSLGRITFWEIMVVTLFSSAMLLFFCRSPQIFFGWGDAINEYFQKNNNKFVLDSAAAMLITFLMFLLPSSLIIFKNCTAKEHAELPAGRIPSVLDWTLMNDICPYSFMFLLGGGFALSEAAKEDYTDLNRRIGGVLRSLNDSPNLLIIFIIIIFTIFITNFASNVAICNVVAPIAMQMGKEINRNPLWYNIAAGFSSSFAFMLPVGTPGNLVVQSAAHIPTGKMIMAGLAPTVTTLFLTWIAISFWAPIIWPDLYLMPI